MAENDADQKKPQTRKRPGSGFSEFLRGQGVVGLAIGFVIGTQVQVVVKQLLDSFINPILGLTIGNGGSFTSKVFTIHLHGKVSHFAWGSFIYSLINFLILVLVLYLVIKLFRLDKLDKKS